MCNLNHSLDLTNSFLKLSTQADKLSHVQELTTNLELILISGTIKNPCEIREVALKCNGFAVKILLVNKAFKHLIKLKTDNKNLLQVTYCQKNLFFEIIHESPRCVFYDVQPLYIIPAGCTGRFQTTSDDTANGIPDALEKIDLAMELCRSIVSTKVGAIMGSEKSFKLNECIEFHSKISVETAQRVSQWSVYDFIAGELQSENFSKNRKFVGFLSCTKFDGLDDNEDYSYDNIKAKTKANPALGGDFLCLLGSGTMFSWPKIAQEVKSAFSNPKSVDLKQVLDDSNYRRTYGGCFATSLGSLIHEVGHIFDLAHTESGLMGNDIDFIHRMFLCENLTENLPKRTMRKCEVGRSAIQVEKLANFKLTRLKKPGNEFLDKFRTQKGNDMTFFEENCAVTMWNHKWFTQNSEPPSEIIFDRSKRLLKAKSHLKLIEIRELESKNSMLIKFFSLEKNIENVKEFQIPADVNLENVVLFAITASGDICKETFSAS